MRRGARSVARGPCAVRWVVRRAYQLRCVDVQTTAQYMCTSSEKCTGRGAAAGLRDADLRKLHVFVSDPARPAEAPSAQIGLRSDLEMVTPEVATKSASRNVVALKNKMGHQVDADGKRR